LGLQLVRPLRPLCRDDLAPEGPYRDEALDHLAHFAFSAAAGPSSPEAWFRADGEVLVLVNRFRGPNATRCLAPLPDQGGRWRPEGCVAGPPSGGF
jgi:hypothetical protein